MPLSTSPMDAFTSPVKDAIRPRAYALKPRADNPNADAHAAARLPPGRRTRLRQAHPPMAQEQQRPAGCFSPRRCRRGRVSRRCADRRMLCDMR
jgi:hypothetical protein